MTAESGLGEFWAGYDATLTRIRREMPNTAAGVIAILNDFLPRSAGQAFFGNNADDTLADALIHIGWNINFHADYLWEATHPVTGERIHYVEGDVYEGPEGKET